MYLQKASLKIRSTSVTSRSLVRFWKFLGDLHFSQYTYRMTFGWCWKQHKKKPVLPELQVSLWLVLPKKRWLQWHCVLQKATGNILVVVPQLSVVKDPQFQVLGKRHGSQVEMQQSQKQLLQQCQEPQKASWTLSQLQQQRHAKRDTESWTFLWSTSSNQ